MTITIIDTTEAADAIADKVARDLMEDLGNHGGFGLIGPASVALYDMDPETRAAWEKSWAAITREAIASQLLGPEELAMLQALYSRSPASVSEHLEKVRQKGADGFMKSFYVGYGHASIGDCGVTTLFIEGVTMLHAKAVQDWPLYSGQEASTRYMDFSKAEFANPLGTAEGEAIQEAWRTFYLWLRPRLVVALRRRYPPEEGVDDVKYERAIAARSFDIARGFLPAGAATNLSWTTNLRQANDKIRWLLQHPDESVRSLATQLLDQLRAKYENSFGNRSLKEAREGGRTKAVDAWTKRVMEHHYFLRPPGGAANDLPRLQARVYSEIAPYADLLRDRPRGAELPPFLDEVGTIRSEFLLDYGSYRDAQRHRNGVVRMPLLTTGLGFHPWYLAQVEDAGMGAEAVEMIRLQGGLLDRLDADPVTKQAYIGMGYRVPVRYTQGIPGFVYRLEMRSSKTVHPTFRHEVLREVEWFEKTFPYIALYADKDPDDWTVRRGEQTIEERPQ